MTRGEIPSNFIRSHPRVDLWNVTLVIVLAFTSLGLQNAIV